MGVFLKTQEVSEYHKFLGTQENSGRVTFENFVASLKCDVPESVTAQIDAKFTEIAGGNENISVDTLKGRVNLESDIRVKCMLKSVEQFEKDICLAIDFVCRGKNEVNREDFAELHRNMFYVQPKANLGNWFKVTE